MSCCSAVNCSNRMKRGSGRTFHVFPQSRPELLRKWILNMKRYSWIPNKRSVLCSDHFEEKCFDRTGQTVRLKSNAEPTIFSFPMHLIKESKLRKSPCKREYLKFHASAEEDNNGESYETPDRPASEESVQQDHSYSTGLQEVKRKLDDVIEKNVGLKKKKHFAEDQWEAIRVDGKKKLKANAVPTIFEISKKRNSDIKKKRGRIYKLLENVEINDSKKNFETNNETVLEPSECLVCCFPLENGHEVNLGSLTKTSGVAIHERLTSISGGEAVKLRSCKNDGMGSLCMRCAHLVNYVDRMEAELALLKGAISSCLKNFNGDNRKLDAEVKSHVLVLDQFEAKLLGQNLGTSKEKLMKQNLVSFDADADTWSVIDVAPESEKLNEKDSLVSPEGLPNGDGELPKEGMNTTEDKEYQCRICLIRTRSRSVLFFHLRKHMATYQWCDFCDVPLKSIEDEDTNGDSLLCEVKMEACDDIL